MFIDFISDCASNGLGSWWDNLEEAHWCSLINSFLKGPRAHTDGPEVSRPFKTMMTIATKTDFQFRVCLVAFLIMGRG